MEKSIYLTEDKMNKQYLIAIYNGTEIIQYVVCKNYNPQAKYGQQWDWGHYFLVDHGDALENALEYLHRREIL